jgi:hypothetical protein
MFAELVHSGGEGYHGIVAIATDLRLERRRQSHVVGDGMNLFVAGAIESCGKTVHTIDEVATELRNLARREPRAKANPAALGSP